MLEILSGCHSLPGLIMAPPATHHSPPGPRILLAEQQQRKRLGLPFHLSLSPLENRFYQSRGYFCFAHPNA